MTLVPVNGHLCMTQAPRATRQHAVPALAILRRQRTDPSTMAAVCGLGVVTTTALPVADRPNEWVALSWPPPRPDRCNACDRILGTTDKPTDESWRGGEIFPMSRRRENPT